VSHSAAAVTGAAVPMRVDPKAAATGRKDIDMSGACAWSQVLHKIREVWAAGLAGPDAAVPSMDAHLPVVVLGGEKRLERRLGFRV
jgi:hypothetical protein